MRKVHLGNIPAGSADTAGTFPISELRIRDYKNQNTPKPVCFDLSFKNTYERETISELPHLYNC